MRATNNVDEVKHYCLLGMIGVAILEDGRKRLGMYMAEAGYPDEQNQIIDIVSVALEHEEPKLIVKFNFHTNEPGQVEVGSFFIWINDDETVGGDF